MTDDVHARLVSLVDGVALPLARGGRLRPARPFGGALAAQLADAFDSLSPAETSALRRARGDLLRRLYATDDDPAPGRASLLLLASLNDLLQCLNPSLGARRAVALAADVDSRLRQVAPPETLGEALCRHATLQGLSRLVRHDVAVTWWSGHATIVGRDVPARLRAWPRLRRVREAPRSAALRALAAGAPLPSTRYAVLLRMLLSTSPLTEMSLAHVIEPAPTPLHARLSATSLGAGIVRRVLDVAGEDARRAWSAASPR